MLKHFRFLAGFDRFSRVIYISSLWIEPENKDTAVEESNRLKAEINALTPYEWKAKNHDHENEGELKISVLFKIFFSMLDAGFLSYMTDNITDQRCSFCHLLPRQEPMN